MVTVSFVPCVAEPTLVNGPVLFLGSSMGTGKRVGTLIPQRSTLILDPRGTHPVFVDARPTAPAIHEVEAAGSEHEWRGPEPSARLPFR